MILDTDTVVNPRTVVIETLYTLIADVAVPASDSSESAALWA